MSNKVAGMQVFIVQCKKLRNADVKTVSSKAVPAVADDFLNQGMNCVTASQDSMFTSDESAKTLAPVLSPRGTIVEDTINGIVEDLLGGQYKDPVSVIGFDTMERSLVDVSEDVARELRQRCSDHDRRLPEFLHEFVGRYGEPEAQARSADDSQRAKEDNLSKPK